MTTPDPGSYRDPSGFVFRRDGVIYRQINGTFSEDWAQFESSGLARALVDDGLMVEYSRADDDLAATAHSIAVIRPRQLAFISYPFEWCFSQLIDAALLTLRIEEIAVEHGMTLRDASGYNVQFDNGQPIWIDTLSFERLPEDATWKPYRQFCEHFLGPLAVMAKRDLRLGSLLRVDLDGIPLDLAARLLPRRSAFNLGLWAHIRLHARSQASAQNRPDSARRRAMGKTQLLALIDGLRRTVQSLRPPQRSTAWGEYTPLTSYSPTAARAKEAGVRRLLDQFRPTTVWDVGANDGHYSAIAAEAGRMVVALDSDPNAVERHYRSIRGKGSSVLPLLIDLGNPTPGLGWNNMERSSLIDRGPADTVMALALVHHLAIGMNLPFEHISSFFTRISKHLILEFVPKSDPMTQRLLASREDVFPNYTLAALRETFGRDFEILDEQPIDESDRVLLGMVRRN